MRKLIWGIVGLALSGAGYVAYDWHEASKEQKQPPKTVLYAWSDGHGVRHFTDTPPPSGARDIEKSQGYAPVRRPLLLVIRDFLRESYEKERELLMEKLKGGGFEWVRGFTDSITDTQAFLVVKDEWSYAVLAFRGTEVTKLKDITTDIKAGMAGMIEGKVHRGFRQAYESVKDDIKKSVAKLEGIPLYITGHSLGAALATLATQTLEENQDIRDQIAACYTFGSPRVGNKEFDKKLKSVIYRVVNTTDIVTVIPLLLMGYIHIGDVRFR